MEDCEDGWMDVHFYFISSQTSGYHIVNAIILHNIWERWSGLHCFEYCLFCCIHLCSIV